MSHHVSPVSPCLTLSHYVSPRLTLSHLYQLSDPLLQPEAAASKRFFSSPAAPLPLRDSTTHRANSLSPREPPAAPQVSPPGSVPRVSPPRSVPPPPVPGRRTAEALLVWRPDLV